MAKTHKYHPEAGKNSHLSLVDNNSRYWTPLRPTNDKTRIWSEDLTCLWTDANYLEVLQIKRGIPDGYEYDGFIAMPYTSKHTPGLECGRSRGYTMIEAGGESRRQSIVRDEVLTRGLRYARHNGIRRFWTDRECSHLEDDAEEKQVTMNSMDLLYRGSRHPIGLLAVILKTQPEVNDL
jgi:hypothetical protein